MDVDSFFEQRWPEQGARLGRYLVRRGVPPREREDLVQETALRLIRTWPTVDQERVEPLARTIAMNLWRDHLGAARRCELLVEPPERAGASDVERAAVARVELGRVGRALARLTPAQRRTLVGDLAQEPVAPLSAAQRMARMRARAALTAALRCTTAVAARPLHTAGRIAC